MHLRLERLDVFVATLYERDLPLNDRLTLNNITINTSSLYKYRGE